MNRLGVFLAALWGSMCLTPLSSHSAILVINMQDPKTVSSFDRLTSFEQESALSAVGDIISVREDSSISGNQRFGKKECANKPPADGGALACVEILGLSKEEARDLAMPIIHKTQNDDLVVVRYRRFQIRWETLSEGVRYDLFQKGLASLELADWREYVIDKEAAK